MTGFRPLLSNDGRIGRQGYVLGFAVPLGVLLALSWAGFTGAAGAVSSQVLMVAAVGWTILMGVGDALNVRRYHDLGNSGRMYLLFRPLVVVLPLLAFALQFLLPALMASTGSMGALVYMMGLDADFRMAPAPVAVLLVWGAGVVGNVAYLSVMPGEAGPNAYGDGPGTGPRASGAESGGDPVARAMADYQAGLAAPKAKAAPAMAASRLVTQVAPRPGGTFGKKR